MSGPYWWCDFCQDETDIEHDDESGQHKVGRAFGPTGRELAIAKELRELIANHQAEDGGDLDQIWPSEIAEILNRKGDPE